MFWSEAKIIQIVPVFKKYMDLSMYIKVSYYFL